MMKTNMGYLDRAIRIVLAIVLIALVATAQLNGVLAYIAVVLAIVFVATSSLRFCPLYLPFKISTLAKKK